MHGSGRVITQKSDSGVGHHVGSWKGLCTIHTFISLRVEQVVFQAHKSMSYLHNGEKEVQQAPRMKPEIPNHHIL